MSDVSQIDGSAVRLSREAQGWAINDLAARACLSVKQVRQIEEGGLSSFYSESVKLTAARKVAALLQMSEAQLFGQVPLQTPQTEESLLFASHTEPVLRPTSAEPTVAMASTLASSGVHLSRSEALHVLAQPPEMDWTANPDHQDDHPPRPTPIGDPTTAVTPTPVNVDTTQVQIEPVASGNYFLKILVLFLVAIAVAALLRPKSTEPSATAPEVSTGQSMTPSVQPATGDTSSPAAAVSTAGSQDAAQASESKPLNPSEGAQVQANTPAVSAPVTTEPSSPSANPAANNKP